MDQRLNRIPERIRKVHLVAVCGTAMGALACMLKELGYRVTGSDEKVYPPMSTYLAENGIDIREGFSGDNIDDDTDLVIIGNAVRRDNPESEKTRLAGFDYCSMPQAINSLVGAGKKRLVVTGTHGKTTTSSLLAWVLECAGLDPSFMIGGILKNFGCNSRMGNGEYIVLEGDEYDTAFFDKGPKFLHYSPHIAILTSVEFDHADIFTGLGHVKSAFRDFVSRMPENSSLIAFDSDINIEDVINESGCRISRYGKSESSVWRISGRKTVPPYQEFTVLKNGERHGVFKLPMPGSHNAFNALSVIAAADELCIPAETVVDALSTFEGVKRRQEIRGVKRGITVLDDFAHHPTAVRETVGAVKSFYQNGRLIAVFEPRTNSSMRKIFQDVYPASFDEADMVCIREPSAISKIPGEERISTEKLVSDIDKRGTDAKYFKNTDDIISYLQREAAAGDVILVMSNGGFDNIHERLLNSL